VAETAGTDEVELRGFDNKCILEYFKEKEFLSIVKEWRSKNDKPLLTQNEKLEKRQREKQQKKQRQDEHSKSNKE
jgi:bifunctional DNA-binding transcriptional regulator/antitoxin component of YhaV-PrlF toxin-antitoxin module